MNKEKITRILINTGLVVFLILNAPLEFFYFGFLWKMIVSLEFKNMNNAIIIEIGLLAMIFALVDFLIILRFIRLIRKQLTNLKNEKTIP